MDLVQIYLNSLNKVLIITNFLALFFLCIFAIFLSWIQEGNECGSGSTALVLFNKKVVAGGGW